LLKTQGTSYMLNHSNVMSLEELLEAESCNKHLEKGLLFGNKKINMDYYFKLRDTAKFNASEAYNRKWDLINICKRILEIINEQPESDLEKMDVDYLMDYIIDLLFNLKREVNKR